MTGVTHVKGSSEVRDNRDIFTNSSPISSKADTTDCGRGMCLWVDTNGLMGPLEMGIEAELRHRTVFVNKK